MSLLANTFVLGNISFVLFTAVLEVNNKNWTSRTYTYTAKPAAILQQKTIDVHTTSAGELVAFAKTVVDSTHQQSWCKTKFTNSSTTAILRILQDLQSDQHTGRWLSCVLRY